MTYSEYNAKENMRYLTLLNSSVFLIIAIFCNLVLEDKVYSEISTLQINSNRTLVVQLRSTVSEDIDVIVAISGLSSQWNKAVAPLVRDYLDPNISSEQWAKEASFYVAKLRSIYLEMNALTFMIQDAGIRNIFKEFAENYRAKLSGITALHYAVAYGDATAAKQASQSISKATSEGNQLAQSLLEKLRPYIDNKVLIYELQKRVRNIDESTKPNR